MKLLDTSPMPFGKHKGIPMQDVPTSYLHYLWENGVKLEKGKPVHEYIKDSMDALELEDEDRIWSKPAR